MIRTVVKPAKPMITIAIPTEYVGKEIEVVAFAKGEAMQPAPRRVAKKKVTFDAVSLDTRGFRFNREEANE